MKKKVLIAVGTLVVVALIIVGILLFSKPKQKTSEIQAVGYITYYDQYDSELQNGLKETAASMSYDYLLFGCDRSSSIAESNATSAINSKAQTVFIEYPDAAVSNKVAGLLQAAGVTPIIVGQEQSEYITLSLNTDKAQKEMIDQVKKSAKSADMMVSLSAKDQPAWSKALTVNTAQTLASDLHVDQNYIVSSSIADQQITAKDYVIDLLTTSHDRSNVVIVCDSAKVAAGIQEAAQELGKESAITVVCYDNSSQLTNATTIFVLEKDYSNLEDMIKKPSSQQIKFQITALN